MLNTVEDLGVHLPAVSTVEDLGVLSEQVHETGRAVYEGRQEQTIELHSVADCQAFKTIGVQSLTNRKAYQTRGTVVWHPKV